MVFNAIPDLGAARPDFLDRAVIVEFLDMKPEMRRDEARSWREFEEVRPRILGALLDAARCGSQEPAQRQAHSPYLTKDCSVASSHVISSSMELR